MRKTLKEIATWLNIELTNFQDTVVTGVSIDTRTLKEGDLFIPFRGESVNGHRFVEQAFEKGAAACFWLTDEPNPPENKPIIFVDDPQNALQKMAKCYRDEHKATFVGITGSNGKTSSKDIVASMLSPFFKVQKTIGNFNNDLGLPITILSLDEDTEIAVLEMGMSSFGEIEFLSTLSKPHYAIITNIGEAHMQDLGSREGIAKAKFEIIEGLHEDGMLFYDGDEPLLTKLIQTKPNLHAKSFGLKTPNAIVGSNIVMTEKGSSFFVSGEIEGEFSIPILGEHQVTNALGAMLLARSLKLTDEQIRQGLANVTLTDMRMQLIPTESGILFLNDAYNAAPTSMNAAIRFMQSTSIRTDKWLVLGDMLELGDHEKKYHEEIAEVIDEQKISNVCLYGPRMKWLYEKLKQKFNSENLLYSENQYEQIAQHIKKNANDQTIILLKGSRGMKLETVISLFD